MKKLGIAILVISLIFSVSALAADPAGKTKAPVTASSDTPRCQRQQGVGEGMGRAAVDTAKGIGSGVYEAGKGAVGTAKGAVDTVGYTLTGKGKKAVDSGKDMINATGEGIKGGIEKPAIGLGQAGKDIDSGIKASEASKSKTSGTSTNFKAKSGGATTKKK